MIATPGSGCESGTLVRAVSVPADLGVIHERKELGGRGAGGAGVAAELLVVSILVGTSVLKLQVVFKEAWTSPCDRTGRRWHICLTGMMVLVKNITCDKWWCGVAK